MNLLDNSILAEYRTKKAADNFANRVNKKTWIGRSSNSHFGFPLNKDGKIFQVHYIEEAM